MLDERPASNLNLIVPLGTQIVLRTSVYVQGSQIEYPGGSVAEIVRTPDDGRHSYRAKRRMALCSGFAVVNSQS